MAGMGPAPKSSATRQRRNKKSTAAQFEIDQNADADVPELPDLSDGREWHEAALEEWDKIWTSPMASALIDSDYYGVLKYIILVQDFWEADSARERKEMEIEIRLQRASFGLDPLSRARLHWEIARGDEAQQRQQRRKAAVQPPAPVSVSGEDIRSLLGRQGTGLVALEGGKAA